MSKSRSLGRSESASRSDKRPAPLSALLRAIGQSLAWLPGTLALLPAVPLDSPAAWLTLTLAASLIGAVLTFMRRVWSWVIYLALVAGVAIATAALGVNWLLPALYLGVVAGIGYRSLATAAICMAGVGTNGIALIAATWNSGLAAYKPLFIVSGLIWFSLAAYYTHAKLLNSAGLESGIVTRLVFRSSRRYLLILLAVVIVVYVATSDFHLWRSIVDYINNHAPKPSPPEPDQPLQTPPPALPDQLQQLKQGRGWPKWTDYIGYAIAGAIGIALLVLLVKQYLLDLSWFRALVSGLRSLLIRLFGRKDPPSAAPYTDEKESLLDIGKALREAQNRWRSRRAMKRPLSRREWEQLAASEKVRRLYQESLIAAVDSGYSHRLSDTPGEALTAAETWYTAREGEGTPSARSRWLRQKRALLAELYGRARYGSREASPAELEKLAGEYPWDSRK